MQKQSKNFNNGKFRNILQTPMGLQDNSFFKTLKEFLFSGNNRVPENPLPFIKLDSLQLNYRNSDEVKVTWLGHSSVLVSFEGFIFLTDPMFSKRASPVPFMGPKRFNNTLPFALHYFTKIDAIIISHDHFDHLDYKTIKQIHSKTDNFFVPLGVGSHLEKWGVDSDKIVELDWWEETQFKPNIKFVSTPARHFSVRGFRNRNGTLWTSWIIKSDKHNIYFGGDSGYSPSFKKIGEKYSPFDLTMWE